MAWHWSWNLVSLAKELKLWNIVLAIKNANLSLMLLSEPC